MIEIGFPPEQTEKFEISQGTKSGRKKPLFCLFFYVLIKAIIVVVNENIQKNQVVLSTGIKKGGRSYGKNETCKRGTY